MNEYLYQLVLQYKMTKEEALALQLAFIYMDQSRKYFPDYKHAKLPKRGDPRKGILFKYCWKLLQDSKEELKPSDYPHYIQAQMSILKNIRIGDEHPYIDPNVLVGHQAWARWSIWKKYFNAINQIAEQVKIDTLPDEFTKEIQTALRDTHYTLKARLGDLTKDKVLEEMPAILRWVRANVVSPYFISLSPTAQEYITEKKPKLGFDIPKVEEARQFYNELFGDV